MLALHYPYVLAFEKDFLEVRHVNSGALMQIGRSDAVQRWAASDPRCACSSRKRHAPALCRYAAIELSFGCDGCSSTARSVIRPTSSFLFPVVHVWLALQLSRPLGWFTQANNLRYRWRYSYVARSGLGKQGAQQLRNSRLLIPYIR